MTTDPVYLSPAADGLAWLVLNRPGKRNALDQAMWQAIPPLLARAAADPGIKVLGVRGAGGCFAAGADIAEFGTAYATRDSTARYAADIAAAMDGLADFAKPSIALIEGACVGGGMGLALACDLRFAADTARLGITPAKLGLVYPLGDTKRLVQAVGPAVAKDLLFTGRLVDAAEALSLRLVNRVVPAVELEQAVLDYAAQVAATSQYTARATKRMVAHVLAGQVSDTPGTVAEFLDAVEGEDFQEGLRAFGEKRPPRFPYS